MRPIGYTLIKLILSGDNVQDSEVEFSKGLNVISGASDTGKTFILECIYYVFGGSELPEDIPEARDYSIITLIIQDNANGDYLFIKRNLHKVSDIKVNVNNTEEIVLRHEASNDESSLSGFLFKRLGLLDKELVTNKSNKTRPLYFKDLARLSLIKEDKVFSKTSPILTGQYTKATTETSVFKFVLTGHDYSNLIEAETPKISKARNDGKKELIDELIDKLQKRIHERNYKSDLEQLHTDQESNDNRFDSLNKELQFYKISIDDFEKSRRSTWEYKRVLETKLTGLDELISRFDLLYRQYSSDIERLSSIFETSIAINSLENILQCPLCGADAKNIESFDTDYKAINIACSSEVESIKKLKHELEITISELNADKDNLVLELERIESRLASLQVQIKDELKPVLHQIIDELQVLNKNRLVINENIKLVEQVNEYLNLKGVLGAKKKVGVKDPVSTPSERIDFKSYDKLSRYIENRLKNWNYPDLERVNYSSELSDIIVSNRSRKSHGKGVRAIYHAAFTTGLYKYCLVNNKPHTGFVVIDSPLVVYREPDSGEENFDFAVKESFYRDLANEFKDGQIIIIENDEPPSDLKGFKHIKFTGDPSTGRYGFLPVS